MAHSGVSGFGRGGSVISATASASVHGFFTHKIEISRMSINTAERDWRSVHSISFLWMNSTSQIEPVE